MKLSAQISILTLACVIAFMLGNAVGYVAPQDTATLKPATLTVNGNEIPVLPGTEVIIEIDEEDTQNTNVNISASRGSSKGGDVYTTIDSFASKFQLAAPELVMNGSHGKASAMVYAAKGLAAKGHMVIIGAGVLCFIAGVVICAYWSKRTGLYIAGAGAVLILTGVLLERYPWVALLLPVAGIGLVVYVWYRARQGQRVGVTLRSIVGAIERAPVLAADAVKAEVAKSPVAATVVKSVVAAVKKRL